MQSTVETLESRRMLAAHFASLHHGVLEVYGTGKADKITFKLTHKRVAGANAEVLNVSENGKTQKFLMDAVDEIHVQGGWGADKITLTNAIDTPADVEGGAGADSICGGGGEDTLEGDAGADDIKGGAENDSISGGAGGDDLNGNAGDDTVEGDGGDDNMIGGWGDDTIDANADEGDAGDDTLVGGNGDDCFQHFNHHDRIFGGVDNDILAYADGEEGEIPEMGAPHDHQCQFGEDGHLIDDNSDDDTDDDTGNGDETGEDMAGMIPEGPHHLPPPPHQPAPPPVR